MLRFTTTYVHIYLMSSPQTYGVNTEDTALDIQVLRKVSDCMHV